MRTKVKIYMNKFNSITIQRNTAVLLTLLEKR